MPTTAQQPVQRGEKGTIRENRALQIQNTSFIFSLPGTIKGAVRP
jgi:hypothetical protein